MTTPPEGTPEGTPYTPSEMPGRDVDFGLTDDAARAEHTQNCSTPPAPLDIEVGGGHYKQFKIQPIEFSMANRLNFCQGNVIKYICRYNHKNGREDLEKAKHYIDLLIQLEYENGGKPTVQGQGAN